MSTFEAPDPHSACSAKLALSLTDSVSETTPAEFLPDSVGTHSGELTSLSKSTEHTQILQILDPLSCH